MFDYPPEFSHDAKTAVETEKIRAGRDFKAAVSALPSSRFGPPAGLVDLVIDYILRVFLVFAKQASETGHRLDWSLDRVRSTSLEFLRQFTIEARAENGHYEGYSCIGQTIDIAQMNSVSDGSVLPWVIEKFDKSPQWAQYEELLLACSRRVPLSPSAMKEEFRSDPIDSFTLPSELCTVLLAADQEKVLATIFDIDMRLFKEDPEIAVGRKRGRHLWLLFDTIAAPLQGLADFKDDLVPNFIPRMIEQIRREMSWYPHDVVDLRDFYLAPPIRQWRHTPLLQKDKAPPETPVDDSALPAPKSRHERIRGARPATEKSEPTTPFSKPALDRKQAKRGKTRSEWLDQQIILKQWSSDTDIAGHLGPTYNTIRRYRSGEPSTRDNYVRSRLARAFGCPISEVPE